MSKTIESYEAFWPYYVSQHRHPVNRGLHFAGTTLVLACLVMAVLTSSLWLVVVPIAGYSFAWMGHFVFERNKPATFTYPLWSLRADFRMYRLLWLGRMSAEIRRADELFPAGV